MYEDEDYEDLDTMYSQEVVEDEVPGLSELTTHCLVPTLHGISMHILQLLAACLLFRLISQTVSLPMTVRHVVSSALGLYALIYYFQSLVVDIFILVVAAYVILAVLNALEIKHGPLTSILLFFYLVGNEFFIEPESWQKIRGPEMLVVMKVVSIAFDLDSGTLKLLPDVWEYCGYVLCPGTSVFGVWTSFNEYQNIFNAPVWNVQWVMKAARSLLLSLLFFTLSVCFIEWFIPQESAMWWGMYRDALQFRTSHYFVSYLSETAAVLSGFGSQLSGEWTLNVSEPLHIEFPHSLVQVVIYWNKYMHKWLKIYVFRTNSKYGGLIAVWATYTVSSLLHGINCPLAAILMSLGIYTYAEHSLRQKLSVAMNACVSSRPCPATCSRHKLTTRRLSVALVNWLWSALAVFHLAYLGCIIDTSQPSPAPFPQAFQKWGTDERPEPPAPPALKPNQHRVTQTEL